MKNRFDKFEKETEQVSPIVSEPIPDPIVDIPTERGIILGDKMVNVRKDPSVASTVIRSIAAGKELSIVDTVYIGGSPKPSWYKVKLADGEFGFISAGHVEVI